MSKLQINLGEFLLALDSSGEMENFLDRTTGESLPRREEDSRGGRDRCASRGGSGRPLRVDRSVAVARAVRVMADFTESLPDSALKERLFRALGQRKPFRGFKDALFDDETVRQRWFDFEREAAAREAGRRLAATGIDFEWVTVVAG